MLRALVLLLALGNAGLALWLFGPWRDGPEAAAAAGQARVAAQIQPERLQVLTPQAWQTLQAGGRAPAASSTLAPLGSELLCLQSQAVDAEAFRPLPEALAGLGLGAADWTDLRRELPARWGVVMGPYNDRALLRRKVEELRRLKLEFQELAPPSPWAPGLLLSQAGSEAEALNRLAGLAKRGVRTARVERLQGDREEHRVRIDALAPEQALRLQQALPALAWGECQD
ncbi:hypothetical protein [Ideonella livida]|uniref:SPOR domain-containing protein n=1 Tax=Ideonella livida TaxID=2707176 RepID=A0A7C9THY2_9BURK|nr:hypothetical protein [Ideonella livida]NDY90939.1 hypothetical protein [Ideonella livida]